MLLGMAEIIDSEEIFINYGQANDTVELYKYFHGKDN